MIIHPDSYSQSRSVLAYLTLFTGIATVVPGNAAVATIFACLSIVLGWGNLRAVGRVLFFLILVFTLLALSYEPAALPKAAGNMARIGALIITVMLLSAVLGQSNDLKVISRSLFAGKSLFRYLGMTFGTALLSVPLNFGAVGVVATMVGVQVKEQGDSALARNAARAVVRGFGASPMASPLSISIVMTVTFLPDLSSWKLIAAGLPIAILFLVSGVLTREEEPPLEDVAIAPTAEQSALFPWFRFVAIIALICAGAFVLSAKVGLVYSQSVTLSCLTAVIIGLFYRRVADGVVSLPSLAGMNNELVIMGGSSFLGGIIGTFALSWLGMDFSLPVWAYPLVAIAVPWLFFIGGAIGVNPIISGTLSGSILGPIWPVYGLLGLGLGMVTGWGITVAGTPYSANSLLLERCTGYNAHTVSYGWSLRFSLVALMTSSLVCAVLTLPL
ncbi:hypothetical protein NLU14_05295 [Marinobacter sp. 71-i]|uniref:Uncharacterized protein n=1 Tax=Marinobacter iranensis TaxID=2962607 RepID=A0ABT5Y7I3_9GAMM|nr:hypothetical protein [Marinobacter iranensis]MDF0749640.1 hypothetical protein [Marinobacter iranensis]